MIRITNGIGSYVMRDEVPGMFGMRECYRGDLLEDGEWVPDSLMFSDRGATVEVLTEELELRLEDAA